MTTPAITRADLERLGCEIASSYYHFWARDVCGVTVAWCLKPGPQWEEVTLPENYKPKFRVKAVSL